MGVKQLLQALEHLMCAQASASACRPGQLLALPVLQRGCHAISHHPGQERQLLALLCFKATLFSLSPDKNYIATLLPRKQILYTKNCLPLMSGAKCGDHMQARAKLGWSSANPDRPYTRLPDFHNWVTGKMQKRKVETSNFYLRIEGEEGSQVWLDSSLPILEIWMELFPDGLVKI